jgi:hypothetical protein
MSKNNEITEKNNARGQSTVSCPTCKFVPCCCPPGGGSSKSKDTEAKSKDSESRKEKGPDVLTPLINTAFFTPTPQKLGMVPTPKPSSKRIDEEDLSSQEKPAPEVDNDELQADTGELQADTVKSSIESPFTLPTCTPPGFKEKT